MVETYAWHKLTYDCKDVGVVIGVCIGFDSLEYGCFALAFLLIGAYSH
jgi:hypothetical protein